MTDYTPTGEPLSGSRGNSTAIQNEFTLIQAAVNSKSNSNRFVFADSEAAGGTTNDYVVTVTPAITSYTAGSFVEFQSTHANTGSSTLKISALTAKTFKNVNGSALSSGDIKSGAFVLAFYDGTDFRLVSANDKSFKSGDTYTGTHDFTGATITVPTPASGSAAVTRNYMDAVVMAAGNLPDPTAHDGELISSDGASGVWTDRINATVTGFADGTDDTKNLLFDLSGLPTGTTKTIIINNTAFTFTDPSDTTKRAALSLSGIPTATTRTITVRDRDITLTTPGTEWLQTVTASASATVGVTGFDNSTFDSYIIQLSGVRLSVTNADLLMQMKVGGTLRTSMYFGHLVKSDSGAATYSGLQISSASSLTIADDFGTDNVAAGCDMTIFLNDCSSTARQKKAYWIGMVQNGGGGGTFVRMTYGAGTTGEAAGALTEVRFLPSSGNIVIGDFKLYGVRAV